MADTLDSQGGVPSYTEWIQTTGSEIHCIRFQAEKLETFENIEPSDELTDAERGDPLFALPMFSLFALFSVSEFNMYGLDSVARGDTYELDGSRLEDILILDGTTALAGDIDTGSMEKTVLGSRAGSVLESSDTIGDFTIFSAPDGPVEPIAIGEDGVVLPAREGPVTTVDEIDDPGRSLQETLATYVDGLNRAVEENDDFAWMVAEAGHGTICIAGYGEDYPDGDSPNFEALSGLLGLVCSLEYDSNEFTGEFAGIVGDADVEALRESLGRSADTASVETDGERVTATATWER